MWGKRKNPFLLFLSYMICNIILSSSLSSLNASFPNCHFQAIPLLSLHHNRPSGQESHLSFPFYTNPPLLYSFASLYNPTPINTPLSFSLFHFLLFSFFLASCSLQQRSHQERELLLLLPLSTIFLDATDCTITNSSASSFILANSSLPVAPFAKSHF